MHRIVWKFLKEYWEILLFGLVGLACLIFGFKFLYDEKVPHASAVVASEMFVMVASDLVSRTSGLLPTKPASVTELFILNYLSKLFCSSKGPTLLLSLERSGWGLDCTEYNEGNSAALNVMGVVRAALQHGLEDARVAVQALSGQGQLFVNDGDVLLNTLRAEDRLWKVTS